MRIAFFTDDYLPHIHGVTTSIKTYREALEKLGHEVYIVAPKKPGYDDHDDHIIRMMSVKNYVFEKKHTSVLYPGLAKKLDQYDFDIVHSQMQFYLGILAQSVAKRKNIPHVTTVHTLYTEMIDDYPFMITAALIATSIGFPIVFRSKPIMPFKNRKEIRELRHEDAKSILKRQGWRLTAEFANRTDCCISPSKHLADILADGGLTVPCEVFPNCINTERYAKAQAHDSPITKEPGDKMILCVARMSAEKRQDVLLDAVHDMRDPHVKLVLAGGGTTEKELRAQAAELGITDQIIFAGMCSQNEIAAMMKQANVLALSSYHFDNQPMVFLEAAASGLPIVYCDERMSEGLTKDNAVLTDGIDGAAFAKVFASLFANPKELARLAQGSLKVAKKFDSITMAKKMVKLYEKIIANKQLIDE